MEEVSYGDEDVEKSQKSPCDEAFGQGHKKLPKPQGGQSQEISHKSSLDQGDQGLPRSPWDEAWCQQEQKLTKSPERNTKTSPESRKGQGDHCSTKSPWNETWRQYDHKSIKFPGREGEDKSPKSQKYPDDQTSAQSLRDESQGHEGGRKSPSLPWGAHYATLAKPQQSHDLNRSPNLQPGTSSQCEICDRRAVVLTCRGCGNSTRGRVRQTCPNHPRVIHLMDISVCSKCKCRQFHTSDYMGPPDADSTLGANQNL